MSEPKIAQRFPYVSELEPGSYWWCACGLSSKQPFCNGSHKVTDIEPILAKIDEKKTVAWCGCKRSNNKPFCDGTHRNIE